MEQSSKINILDTTVAFFKGVLSVSKIIVSAVLIHAFIYIAYLATAGYSIENGALFKPNVEDFLQFNSAAIMVFLPILMFGILCAGIVLGSVSKMIKSLFGTSVVAFLVYLYGPYYNYIPAPNLFLVAIIAWCILPYVLNGLSDILNETLADDFECGDEYAVKRLQKLQSRAYKDTKTGAIIYKTALPGTATAAPIEATDSSESISASISESVSESTSISTSESASESISTNVSEVAIWNTPLVPEKSEVAVSSSEVDDDTHNINSMEPEVSKDTINHLEAVLSAKFGGATYVEPDKVDDMLDSAIREQNHEDVLESIVKYKETSHRRYGGHKG